MLKKIWTSKLTTIVIMSVAMTAVLLSLAINFGQPSPTKVIGRLLFVLFIVGHLVTVYPKHVKRLLFGTDEKILPKLKIPRLDSFYALSGVILLISFVARLYRFTKFITVDESKWLVIRIPTFFNELQAFNWSNLLISDKPGVMIAWIVKLGWLFTNKDGNPAFLADPEFLFFSRLPLLIVNILFLFWLTMLVKKATNSKPAALLFLALTATNPNIMGMAPIVNPDSISWFFPMAIVLSFFLYLRDRQPWDLLQASLILAGGVLNKFNALVALPFLPVLVIMFFLFSDKKPADYFKFSVASLGRLYILSAVISTALWPYLLVNPQHYLQQTLFRPVIKPLFIPILLSLFIFWFWGQLIARFLTKFETQIKKVILVSVPLILLGLIFTTFWLTPSLPSVAKGTNVEAPFGDLVFSNFFYHLYSQTTLTLVLYILAGIATFFFAFRIKKTDVSHTLIIMSLLFTLFYLAGSAATGHITSPRYQIPVFPAISLLIVAALLSVVKGIDIKKFSVAVVAIAAAINFALVLPFSPYYLFYHNHFLPRGKLVFDGWGLGGYEAAQFLNKKPNAEKLMVYASYGGFSKFFKGSSMSRSENPFAGTVDYLVLFKQSDNHIIIGNDQVKNDYWRHQAKADFQIVINGVPIVKVIKKPSEKQKL